MELEMDSIWKVSKVRSTDVCGRWEGERRHRENKWIWYRKGSGPQTSPWLLWVKTAAKAPQRGLLSSRPPPPPTLRLHSCPPGLPCRFWGPKCAPHKYLPWITVCISWNHFWMASISLTTSLLDSKLVCSKQNCGCTYIKHLPYSEHSVRC